MNDYRAYVECDYNSIYHYGVKGTKWGVRRYQYEDGSLTPEGKEHYKQLAAGVGGMAAVTGIAALAERRANRLNEIAKDVARSRGTYADDMKKFTNRTNDFTLKNRKSMLKRYGRKRGKKLFAEARGAVDSENFRKFMMRNDSEFADAFRSRMQRAKNVRNGQRIFSKMSKKGKIGLAIGATALAAAGGYALYKHNKKKKQKQGGTR